MRNTFRTLCLQSNSNTRLYSTSSCSVCKWVGKKNAYFHNDIFHLFDVFENSNKCLRTYSKMKRISTSSQLLYVHTTSYLYVLKESLSMENFMKDWNARPVAWNVIPDSPHKIITSEFNYNDKNMEKVLWKNIGMLQPLEVS